MSKRLRNIVDDFQSILGEIDDEDTQRQVKRLLFTGEYDDAMRVYKNATLGQLERLPQTVLARILYNLSIRDLSYARSLNSYFKKTIDWFQLISRRKRLGTLYTFGDTPFIGRSTKNSHTPAEIAVDPSYGRIESITGFGDHSAFITSSGKLFTYGSNLKHRANSLHTNVTFPIQINFQKTITKVACGDKHTMCIDDNGSLYGWGNGKNGRLGDGNTSTHIVRYPLKIPGIEKATDVSCGIGHTGIVIDGFPYTCGKNAGQLGHSYINGFYSISTLKKVPRTWPDDDYIVNILCGFLSTYIITQRGNMYACGSSVDGQLGNGIDDPHAFFQFKPIDFDVDERIIYANCNYNYVAFITENHLGYSFGNNEDFKLGTGSNAEFASKPMKILVDNIKHLACGSNHMAIITYDNDLYVVGSYDDDDDTIAKTPLKITVGHKNNVLRAVSCGTSTACVLVETPVNKTLPTF